jgi:heat shock protein HtpX
MALFAVLAIVMVVASYLFVLLLAGACVYLPYLVLFSSDSPGVQSLALFLFGIVIAAAMLWSLVPRRDKFAPPGMLLSRETEPRLFAELEDIAMALNEPLPREVYLIGDVNAFVADRGGILGFGSRRVMGLGLPLLSVLTVSQFRAVLAHEFAHYYGGDTSLGPWVYKTKMAIVRIFENIGAVGQLARIAVLGVMYMVVASVLKWYFILFLRVINLVSRRQEYRADELACLVAGRQPLIDGLRAIHATAMAWPAYWSTEVAPGLSEGSLLAIGEGLARFMAAPMIAEQIETRVAKNLEEAKTNPYDTHPPLRDRIAAAMKLADGSGPSDAQPASTLLQKISTTELRFIEDRIPEVAPGTLKYVAWDDVALQVTIPAWQKFVGDYAAALQGVTAESLPDQIRKLPAIGQDIRDPKGMLLAPGQRTHRAGQLFGASLALALIQAGWEVKVQPGVFCIQRGAQQLNPFLIMDQLLAEKLSREAWASQCHELGISNLALSPAERDSNRPPDSSTQPGLFGSEASSNP